MDDLINKLLKLNAELLKLNAELLKLNAKLSQLNVKPVCKGKQCSISGKKYEQLVYNCVKSATINGKLFVISDKLAGCSAKNDLSCAFADNKFGVEIKKCNTPDWMQCLLKPIVGVDGKILYPPSKRGIIPYKARELFANLLQNKQIFNEIPPFVSKCMTYNEWCKEKHNFKDIYVDIPNDTISKMYSYKGCNYIQISEYGLYHTGNDICKFGVTQFVTPQHIRVRVKIHKKCNKSGFCNLSIMAACSPKNIKKIIPSMYSLDNIDSLPINLKI